MLAAVSREKSDKIETLKGANRADYPYPALQEKLDKIFLRVDHAYKVQNESEAQAGFIRLGKILMGVARNNDYGSLFFLSGAMREYSLDKSAELAGNPMADKVFVNRLARDLGYLADLSARMACKIFIGEDVSNWESQPHAANGALGSGAEKRLFRLTDIIATAMLQSIALEDEKARREKLADMLASIRDTEERVRGTAVPSLGALKRGSGKPAMYEGRFTISANMHRLGNVVSYIMEGMR